MARKLSEMPLWGKGTPIYPWDQWLDGSIWELTQGEDFACEVKSLQSVAHTAARNRRLKVTTRMPGHGVIVIQARPQ